MEEFVLKEGGSDLPACASGAALSQAALQTHQESPCKAQMASENTTGIVLTKAEQKDRELGGLAWHRRFIKAQTV